jgi:preprotein translocase subunit SecE
VGSNPAWPVSVTPSIPFGKRDGVLTVKKESIVTGRDEKPKRENGLSRFWNETVAELRKVSWPSRQEATNLTIVVLIVMVTMSLFLFFVDSIAEYLLKLAINAG